MPKLLESLGLILNKYGLFPAVSVIALCLGGYGCYTAQLNSRAIHAQAVEMARLESRLDSSTEKLTERMGGVERNLIELTTQIRLLVDGKLVISK